MEPTPAAAAENAASTHGGGNESAGDSRRDAASDLHGKVVKLREAQAPLMRERKEVTASLTNTHRKRQRLEDKARNLSDAVFLERLA